ncbi:MAG: BatD family protein [Chitinophagaceae bacterium]
MLHFIYILASIITGPTAVSDSRWPFVEDVTVCRTDYQDTIKRSAQSRTALTVARENVLKPGERVSEKIQRNLFVKVNTNKTSCYVGEPILAEYKLYSRLVAKSKIIKQPLLNGFTVYDMMDFVPLAESEEIVQGKRFKVHTLRKTQLIPLQTGILELDPMELENTVQLIKSRDLKPQKGNQLNDLLDVFLDEESAPAITQSAKTQSNTVVVSVNALPDNDRPPYFNGAVGRFTISATIDSSRLSAQNAAILTVEISGKGNLALIEAPEIQWPQGFESMDTRSSEELDKTVIPLEGTKRFEYSFIAEREGSFIIPPVLFAYFDPSGITYKTISTKAVPIRVSAGDRIVKSSKPESSVQSLPREDNSIPALLKAHFALILVVLLALIGILFMWLQMLHRGIKVKDTRPAAERTKDTIGTTLTAPRNDPLQKTRTLSTDPHGFYKELNKVLLNTLAEKFQRSPGELYKPYIMHQLQLKGWNDMMTADLVALLTECEQNLYSSNEIPARDVAASLYRAERVMAALEKW